MELGAVRRARQSSRTAPGAAAKPAPKAAQAAPRRDQVTLSRQAAALLLAEQAKRAEKKERNWWELDLVQKEEQEENGAGQELKKQRICQRIAARIMAGDKVPPEDLQYLMEHDLQSYQLAMAARVPKEHPKEWKSALEKEKQPSDAASQEGEAASDGGGAPEVSGGETV
ncbi:MAG: hypothetical protein HFG09_05245 [Oscillibacter sp.]|nr:hypothetical protein [Oscillibacter sp.]